MERFKDKVVFVSGATSGIGRAAALRMGLEGATVIVSAHLMEYVDATVDDFKNRGIDAHGVYYDGTDMESIKLAIRKTIEDHGRIDVLVNNVGGTDMKRDGAVTELDMQYFESAMDINVKGTLTAIREAIPSMKSGGAIVNVASIGGITGDFRGTLYGMAKAAVIDLTQYVATQYGHRGVRCNAVAPGLILTKAAIDNLPPAVRDVFASQTPLPYFGNPEDVGATIAFLASSDARFITGQTIIVDGGMLCHNPTALQLANKEI